MRSKRWQLVSALAITSLSVLATSHLLLADAPTTPALLTADEVKKLVDSGQYRDGLKALTRILALKPGTEGYSHFDMLMLRAECQLQLKQNASALDSLQQTKKDTQDDPDDKRQLTAEGLADLIKASSNAKYQPKTGDSKDGIDILNQATRKAAFQAQFNDELVIFKGKAKVALDGKTLPPYIEPSHLAFAMRAAEFNATGDTAQSKAAIGDLAQGALTLMKNKLKIYETDVSTISMQANQIVTTTVPYQGRNGQTGTAQRSYRQGLSGSNVSDLNQIKGDLVKYPQAATELATLFDTLKSDFTEVGGKAQSIIKKADVVLTANYSTGNTVVPVQH